MLNGKSILITGGTGSFGQKFTEYILNNYEPKRIIIYSRDEYKQFIFKNEINKKFPEKSKILRFFIGDVRDKDRLKRAFNNVDYVIHAAAMKQVPACEYNPFEAVQTNIIGAKNIIDVALDLNVKKVIALSTDKAVSPINLYGGTKLVSDKLFIAGNAYSGETGTIFSVVRYGNVAGSRGSVIPYFYDLLREGVAELPITDFNMTRFWITLEQGIGLVMKALNESVGGETFISKIPSVKITDLAKAINSEIKIKEVGIREGEKLHELMITRDDSSHTYEFENHFIIYPNFEWWNLNNKTISKGKKVDKDFEYNSGTNKRWLNIDEIKLELRKLGY
jgi:UDP-N-acetylglucosamine 4,6-dehydratase (inverting)